MASLFWSNDLDRGDILAAGQALRIPRISGIPYVIQAGDTLESIAQKFQVSPQAIVLLTGVRELSVSYLYQGKWHSVWPIGESGPQHPAAVQVALVLTSGERFQRVFALP